MSDCLGLPSTFLFSVFVLSTFVEHIRYAGHLL